MSLCNYRAKSSYKTVYSQMKQINFQVTNSANEKNIWEQTYSFEPVTFLKKYINKKRNAINYGDVEG